MKITAVIIAYWPSRHPAVPSIVEDLRSGTRVPDHIVVLNNNHRQPLPPIPGASIINCGWNYTSRAKYAAAMLEPSDYYLLLDDDVSVGQKFLGRLADLAHPDCCFCDIGAKMVSNYASAAKVVSGSQGWASGQDVLCVDIFQGSVQFISFGAIVRMLDAETKIRLSHLPAFRSVGEDLFIAMANPDAAVVATQYDGGLGRVSRPQGQSAMQFDFGYYAIRDWFGYKAWISTGHKPFPGPVPGVLPGDQKHIEQYVATVTERDQNGANMENKP